MVLERSRTYTRERESGRAWSQSPVLLLLAVSGTNTDSRSSETPPEPYEDGAKAEQPRPTTTEKKMHSSLVEQNLPKRKPERVEVGSVSCTVLQMYGPGLVTSRARCTGKAERTEGVVDAFGAYCLARAARSARD